MDDLRATVWYVVFSPDWFVSVFNLHGEKVLHGIYRDVREELGKYLHDYELEASAHLPTRAFRNKKALILERTGPGGTPLRKTKVSAC